ncbi:glycosyltransferase family 4 protein [Bradyrhizobium sp.]|uniref:glycosyltransferase family 4 protein n=1 Tax=Bradyrhizobium sp. TaxID=376 RepID=UPI003C76E6E2
MRPPRVAAVAITPPTFKASGGVSAAIQLTKEIARLCDATLFVMAEHDGDEIEDGLRIVRRKASNILLPIQKFLPRQATTLAWRPDLLEPLQDGKFDVVHLHNPHPPGAMREVARICARLKIPYVVSTHGFIEFNDFSRGFESPAWQKPLLRLLVRRPVVEVARGAARVLMLSPCETPVLSGMGIPAERLRVVTNGVDRYFSEVLPEAERQRLVQRFALPTGRPLMLFVGNHTPNKGIDTFLEALQLMREAAVAVIAGQIRSRDEHAKLLASRGLAPDDARLRFTDFITREELRALYQSVDLFVFPSRADTLPLVILEAMISGLPVVSTRVGGIPFEVTPATGLLVEPGDADALARALDTVCADPAMRARLGAAGRSRAIETFNWKKSAELAVSIYGEIIQHGSGNPGACGGGRPGAISG